MHAFPACYGDFSSDSPALRLPSAHTSLLFIPASLSFLQGGIPREERRSRESRLLRLACGIPYHGEERHAECLGAGSRPEYALAWTSASIHALTTPALDYNFPWPRPPSTSTSLGYNFP